MSKKIILLVEGTTDKTLLEHIIDTNSVSIREINYYGRNIHKDLKDCKKEIVYTILDSFLDEENDVTIYGLVDRDYYDLDGIITYYLKTNVEDEEDKKYLWNKVKEHIFVTDTRDLETLLIYTQKDIYKLFNLSKEEYKKAIYISMQLLTYRDLLMQLRTIIKKDNKERGIDERNKCDIVLDDNKCGCVFCNPNENLEYTVDFDALLDEKNDEKDEDNTVISLKSFCKYVCEKLWVYYTYKKQLLDTWDAEKVGKEIDPVFINGEANDLKIKFEQYFKDRFRFIGAKKDKNKALNLFFDEYKTFDIDTASDRELLEIMRLVRGHDLLKLFGLLHKTIFTLGDFKAETSLIDKYDKKNFFSSNLGRKLLNAGLIRK